MDFKVKVVNELKDQNLNKSISNYKVAISDNRIIPEQKFIIGSRVKHKEENIFGEIKFIGTDKLSIVWDDNTRERMTFAEAIDSLNYVDSIQSEVAPLAGQMSENQIEQIEENGEQDEIFEKALASLDSTELEDNHEKMHSQLDIEKIKMQRKIEKLENKLTTKQTNNLKEKIAKELIDVAVMKNIIDQDDSEIEMQKIIVMNDEEFENYKESVLSYDNSHEITSKVESNEPELTEAERVLKKIKNNGGRGIIGDFSDTNNIISSDIDENDSIIEEGKRSLKSVRDQKITFSNQYFVPTFEDDFVSNLSSQVESIENKYMKPKTVQSQVELPGFENLIGLKKPLIPSQPAYNNPINTNMQELFSNLNWTTLSKRI